MRQTGTPPPRARRPPGRGLLAFLLATLTAGWVAARAGSPPWVTAWFAAGTESGGPRPNVVLVLVDALRADRLGCYGHPGGATPHLDALARRGWRFEQAYSAAPSTVRSVASLFTSTLPFVHRIDGPVGDERRLSVLPEEFLLLPEVLRAHGYWTAMVTTTGWVTPEANYDQGVDAYRLTGRADRELLEAAMQLVSTHPAGPFFVYLHLLDLHDYYHATRLFRAGEPPPVGLSPRLLALRGEPPAAIYDALYRQPETFSAEDVRWLERAYLRELRATDELIGELVGRLEAVGLRDDTLVVVVSDHGEQFLEHGRLVHGGDAFYNEVLRVPLLLAGSPIEAPRVVSAPASTLDLFPTLLELLRIDLPPVLQGVSRAAGVDSGPLVATDGRTWKLIAGGWSYIYAAHHDRQELYDLRRDPYERLDVAAEQRAKVLEMRRLLAATIRAGREHPYHRLASSIATVPMSDEVEKTLQSLGYLQ